MNNFSDKLKKLFGCVAYGLGMTIETVSLCISQGKGILGNIAELSKGIGTEFLSDVLEDEFESLGSWLETHKFNKRFAHTLESLKDAPNIWAAIVEIINSNANARNTTRKKHSTITTDSVAAISKVWLNPYKKDFIVNSCKNSEKYNRLNENDKTLVRDILFTACNIYLEAAFEEFLGKEEKILASVIVCALGSKIDNYTDEMRVFVERHRIAEGTRISYDKTHVTEIVKETFALVCQWCGTHDAKKFVKDRLEENKYICKACGTACFMISHKASAEEIADKIANRLAEFTAELYKKIDEDGKTTRARIDFAEKNIINIVPNIQRLKAALKEDYISKEDIKRLADYISRYAPDHLLVRFVNAFLSPSKDAVSKFLDDFPIGAETEEDVDLITDVLIRYMQATWIETLSVFIEKAYKQNKRLKSYSEIRERFVKQSTAVDDGTYDLTYKRDVFIAYSTEDLDHIRDLVTELEKAEIECFVAYRNLPNCFGEDFKKDICIAMQHCSVLLFASSRNSRHRGRNPVWELQTWHDEQPQKPRFEYLIDDYSIEDNAHVCKQIKQMLPLSYATLGDYATIIDVIDKALPNPYSHSAFKAEYPAKSATVEKHEAVPIKTIQSNSPVIAKADDKMSANKKETAKQQRADKFIRNKFIKNNKKRLPTLISAKQGDVVAQCKVGNFYNKILFYAKAVKWFRLAAEQGHAEAQYKLGNCYYYGLLGVTNDLYEAVKWYKLAAEQGHAEAQYKLGECYYLGYGVKKGQAEVVKWYELAAKQGHVKAQYMLGFCYSLGYGVKEDEVEAVKWFRLAAEQGHAEAQYKLGNCYYYGLLGVTNDLYEDVHWYKLAAEQGHAGAQYKLGECYHLGYGVKKDQAEAVKWYELAAKQDHAEAQYKLGECYYYGFLGVKINYKKAVKWFKLAANKDNADAQYMLGFCYYNGNGVKKDQAEVVKWYRLAAEQGHASAQYSLGYCYAHGYGVTQDYYSLGYCYAHGYGVTQDYKEAVKWYELAAKQDHAEAQYKLGGCYHLGYGVKIDRAEVVKWYELAAKQGHVEAQYDLGCFYDYGHIVKQDYKEAAKWYELAAKQGHALAKHALEEIKKYL